MRKPKQPKTTDPVKLAQMRERMAKARAAREAKRQPPVEAAEENGGPILPPPVESDPSPAAPSGDVMTSFTGGGGANATVVIDDSTVAAPSFDPKDAAIVYAIAENKRVLLTGETRLGTKPPTTEVLGWSVDAPVVPPTTEWPSYMPVAHGEREFQVIQMPQNPRLVICRDPSQPDQRFHVDVGNNENFALGMTLKAIPKPAPENAFWKLMGPLPRYKGRY